MNHQINKYIRIVLAYGGLLLGSAIGYSGEVSLTPGELLEEGVYLQEAKGDLNAAIARYRQVIELDANNRPRAAEAQYRLAVCYLEQGNGTAATQAFEALARDFPNQSKWVEAALDHLPKAFEPSFVPWVDGERTHMEIKLPSGDVIANMVYSVSLIESKERSLWGVSSHLKGPGGEQMIFVTVNSESFLPIEAHYYNTNFGSINCSYEDGMVRMISEKSGKEQEIRVTGRPYDNEQAPALMRQFPVEVGFSTEQTFFVPLTGQTILVKFTITAIETVDTKIGSFECYRTDLDVMGQKQSFWITTDEKRKMVKFKNGGMEGTVTQFSVIKEEENVVYENEQLGYSFEHSNNWFSFETKVGPEKSRVDLREAGIITSISAKAFRYDLAEDEESLSLLEQARELAHENIKGYQKRSPEFQVDEGSWKEFEINGSTALSYTGKYLIAGEKTVNKKTFVYSKGRCLTFTMHSPLDEVEARLPMFDAIVASVEIE